MDAMNIWKSDMTSLPTGVKRSVLRRMRISLKDDIFELTLFDSVKINKGRKVTWTKCISPILKDARESVPVDLYKFVKENIFQSDLKAVKIHCGVELETREFLGHVEDSLDTLIVLGEEAALPEDVKNALFSDLDKDNLFINKVQDKAKRMYEEEQGAQREYRRLRKQREDFEKEWEWTVGRNLTEE